jgi:transcriptional regulator with PAS, ATPase and Fis domain
MKAKDYRQHEWVEGFSGAITVCALDGTILEMNAKSEKTFEKDGGRALLGNDVRACHPPAARAKLDGLLSSGKANAYTIEKGRVRKLIYQAPWYKDGKMAGLVEISLEIPERMPHFKRD